MDYVADAAGFRASVRTNEPGTANANPGEYRESLLEMSIILIDLTAITISDL